MTIIPLPLCCIRWSCNIITIMYHHSRCKSLNHHKRSISVITHNFDGKCADVEHPKGSTPHSNILCVSWNNHLRPHYTLDNVKGKGYDCLELTPFQTGNCCGIHTYQIEIHVRHSVAYIQSQILLYSIRFHFITNLIIIHFWVLCDGRGRVKKDIKMPFGGCRGMRGEVEGGCLRCRHSGPVLLFLRFSQPTTTRKWNSEQKNYWCT